MEFQGSGPRPSAKRRYRRPPLRGGRARTRADCLARRPRRGSARWVPACERICHEDCSRVWYVPKSNLPFWQVSTLPAQANPRRCGRNEQRTHSDGRALWESATQIASCPRWNEPQGGACFLQATGAGSPLAAARCRRSATLNAAARCTLSPCAIAQQCRRAAQIARRRKAAAGHVCGCKGVRCPPATAPQPQHGSAPRLSRTRLNNTRRDGRNLRIFSQLS